MIFHNVKDIKYDKFMKFERHDNINKVQFYFDFEVQRCKHSLIIHYTFIVYKKMQTSFIFSTFSVTDLDFLKITKRKMIKAKKTN